MDYQQSARRIVITGGGSGLGRALARRYAADGWRVAVADKNPEAAQQVAAEVDQLGGTGLALECDVRDVTTLQAVTEALEQYWSGVDVVINNAGVGSAGTVIATPLEDWDWTLDINLTGVLRGCHLWAPLLTRQQSGHIVNIASFAGIANAPAMAAYNTAKAGVIALSETLRGELRPFGVGVSVACPSFFRTNLLSSFRSPDPRLHQFAEKMFQRASVTAEQVADDIYQAARKDVFMIISHTDARWLYRLKRIAPGLFFKLVSRRAMALADRTVT